MCQALAEGSTGQYRAWREETFPLRWHDTCKRAYTVVPAQMSRQWACRMSTHSQNKSLSLSSYRTKQMNYHTSEDRAGLLAQQLQG